MDFSHRDPWDEWYIDLHGWLIFMVNVGKYISPMDPMGIKNTMLLELHATNYRISTGTSIQNSPTPDQYTRFHG